MQYQYMWEQSGRLEFARNLDDETLDRWVAYDHVGRLTVSRSGNEARLAINEQVPLIQNGPYSHGYQYDKWGNMTFREGWGGENPSYTITYTNNRRSGFTYDAAGNVTNDGGYSFTYDGTGQAATASASGHLLQHYYDGDQLRVKKSDNSIATYHLRSSVLGGQVVAEIASTGTWQRGYVYMGSQLLAVQQGGVYWMHQDPVVKSKRVTDGSGTVVSSIELDPFGGNTNRTSNGAFQPRWFNTYERDNNGADEAMFRRYNRWWSRFDQPDPYDGSYDLKDPQSFNRFTYVKNDPVNLTDPTGLLPATCNGSEVVDPATGASTCIPIISFGTVTVRDTGGGFDLTTWAFVNNSGFSGFSGIGGPGGGGPGGGGPGGGGPGQPVAPSAQPQSQTAKVDSQQQGFNDCARSAYRAYRKTYLRTSGLAILGGAGVGLSLSTMIGIRGVGFGIRGVLHAAGDEAVPLFGRILTTLSEYKDTGVIATGFAFIGGGMARQGIREAGENSARTEARLKDCERQFPNANHSLSFLNF